MAEKPGSINMPMDVPVLPDGEEAREWALDELAKTVYQEAKPSLFDRIVAAIIDWLRSFFEGLEGVNANLGIAVIVVAVAVLIGLAIWIVKPRLNPAKAKDGEVFDAETQLTSEQHRSAARAAAGKAAFGAAVAEQFRAIVRSAEERAVIDPQPGRTAEEVASRLCRAFPALAPQLRDAGSTFNGVRYGNSPADQALFDGLVQLDSQLLDTRPVYLGAAADTVAPR